MNGNSEAVVSGQICLDVHPDLSGAGREPFEGIFLPGILVAAGPVACSAGEAVSNIGLALHRLGIQVRLAGKAGDDLFGQALRQIICDRGPGLQQRAIAAARKPYPADAALLERVDWTNVLLGPAFPLSSETATHLTILDTQDVLELGARGTLPGFLLGYDEAVEAACLDPADQMALAGNHCSLKINRDLLCREE